MRKVKDRTFIRGDPLYSRFQRGRRVCGYKDVVLLHNLHLLLVPGTAFITGGARQWEQNLHPHLTQLNHTLLTVGILSLLVPAAFFAAIETGTGSDDATVLSDASRLEFLKMSRGVAVVLLGVCVSFFLCFVESRSGLNEFFF